LVSDQKIAEISLNEVDVAKIHVGDKTKVTFDAIENLTIEGKVAEVDQVGSVSQGVVTYNVKISFDTQDERVKSGMSVSTEIITQTKSGVITVPNSAVKTQGNTHYVEVFTEKLANATKTREITSTTAPGRKTVEVGLSNDTLTEITSGLNVGDQIVLKTTSGTTSAATTRSTTPSLFPTGGGNRTGGNATRFAR
jgi:multidrug efflux pump subunit AcrA (membrane-fusion protein)